MQAHPDTLNNADSTMENPKFYSVFYNEEQLYKVEEPEVNTLSKEGLQKPAFSLSAIQGNRSSSTCILFSNKHSATLSIPDEAFLNTILKAVNLSLEQVAWLNLDSSPDFRPENLEQEIILAFGIDHAWFPAGPKMGEIFETGKMKFLYAWPLEELQPDKDKKRILWEALRKLYVK